MSAAVNFNNEIVLFHRHQANRTLKIRIEENQNVAKIDLNSFLANDDQVEEVPCEIVGLEAVSLLTAKTGKKGNNKKANRPVKIRFHPEVIREAKKNVELGEAVQKTAHKLLDQFFGHEWTMEQPKFEDFRHKIVQKLRNVFTSQTGFMVVRNELVLITWPLPLELILTSAERKSIASSNDALAQLFSTVKNALKIWVYPFMETQVSDQTEGEESKKKVQLLDLNLDRNGFKKNVVQFELIGCPLLRDSTQYVHNIELDQENLFVRMYLRTEQSVQENFNVSRFLLHGSIRVIGAAKDKMIDCAQVRVESLRQTLDDSLKSYPRRNSTGSPGILMKAAAMTSEKRPLEVLYQSGSATCIQISGSNKAKISRFNVSPTPNPLPAATIDALSTSPRPLHIIVNDENSRLPTIDETTPVQHSRNVDAIEAAVSTSPSDSIDSGVASPGDISPVSNTENETASCTVDDSAFSELKMRDRSVSEGLLIKPSGIPLKSILKKHPRMTNRSPSFNGGILKRSPAVPRLLFTRSLSECHERESTDDDEAFSSILSGLGINGSDRSSPRMFNSVFDEDDELSLLEDAIGSQASVSEEEPTPPGELQNRKKRVSFSDQVQARIYRSNSSILGQKRKNEKKKAGKLRRRSESESSDTTPIDEQDGTLVKIEPLGPKRGTSLQDLFIPPKSHELERHDSGISDSLEAGLESLKTLTIRSGSPKHKLDKKHVSEDSAIGCDDETEIGEASV